MKFDRGGVRNVEEKKVELNSPEPEPKANPSGVSVWDLVIADMRERDRIGAIKYGQRLTMGDGRKSLVDAYQEALDLAVYLRKEIAEREAKLAPEDKKVDEVAELNKNDSTLEALIFLLQGCGDRTGMAERLITLICEQYHFEPEAKPAPEHEHSIECGHTQPKTCDVCGIEVISSADGKRWVAKPAPEEPKPQQYYASAYQSGMAAVCRLSDGLVLAQCAGVEAIQHAERIVDALNYQHGDTTGQEELSKLIWYAREYLNHAHDILSHPQKRKNYDQMIGIK
jgi:hypothetical protein